MIPAWVLGAVIGGVTISIPLALFVGACYDD
ncbi:hypothetical protein [Providencia phage PSTCR5]|uniref:Uncharacterized protein n=1 Tax=Providencia phage PSTCR5 TaxID=2783547 RepID=A0A873WKZ6_9CAUD|nr:hypothetical protein KNV68_gp048 [Providencia phage PSTCR5]QPB12146.1 hypothetical protein [Providencia phage PSTCR5]